MEFCALLALSAFLLRLAVYYLLEIRVPLLVIANMLDTRMVQVIANRMGFFEQVVYLEEHKTEYANFILTGDAGEAG